MPHLGQLDLAKPGGASKKRLRPDYERGSPIPRQGPTRRGEERPIPVANLRTPDRPAVDLHLVAEDGFLSYELGNVPTLGERPDEANQDEVREGSLGARMVPAPAARNRVLDPDRPAPRYEPIETWPMGARIS